MSILSDKIRSAWMQLRHLHKPFLAFTQSVLIASVAVTVSLIAVRQAGLLEPIELSAYDWMLRLRPDEKPDPRLLVIGITESDIQKLQQWPISDSKIAEILQTIEKMQPRVIGLDVLRDVPLGAGRNELTELLKKSDRLVGVCLVTDGSIENPGSPPPPGMPQDRVGFADFAVDAGGILRRALLFMKPPEIDVKNTKKHLCNDSSQVLFSFNLQLALRYLQAEGIKPQLDQNESLWLGSTQIKKLEKNEGGYKKADVRGYQLLINYRARERVAHQVKLTDVLEGKIDPNLVKDKVVLIGYTTESVKDLFYTPYSAGKNNNQFMPGVVVHAQVVSQILSAVLDKRPLFWFWPEWAEILWISGWSLVGGTLAWRIAHPARLTLASGGMLAVCCGASFGIFLLGGWVPAVAPSLALIVTGGSIVSADRFNKSDYGKVITAKVKQVFKIEIDIGKVQEEVAELEATEAFKKAQQIAKKRNEKQEESQTEPERIPEITSNSSEAQNAVKSLLTEFSQTKPHQIPEITSNSSEAQNAVKSLLTEPSQTKPHQIPEITSNSSEAQNAVESLLTEPSQTKPHQASEINSNSSEARSAVESLLTELSQTKPHPASEITNNSPGARSAVESLLTELSQTKPHPASEITNNSPETQSTPQKPPTNPSDDYLGQLEQKAKQQKQRGVARDSANFQIDIPPTETTSEYELSQLSQMQAKAKKMRERRNAEKKIEDEKTEDLKEV
ncbi:MAG: CHASE2 domain-containing protein [Microcoleus sp.]